MELAPGCAEEGVMRIVAVSNRLPVTLRKEDGAWRGEKGAGGLVSALAPVLSRRGGLWIGWPGITEKFDAGAKELLLAASLEQGFDMYPVLLTQEDIQNFYYGFSNEILWPLFHDLQTRCNFVPAYWYAYVDVNQRFAKAVAKKSRASDYIWVHDYHLLLLGHYLREAQAKQKIGFFLHIPFPSVDIFMKLPWRERILEAMLDYDLIGFQTNRDRRNFMQCLNYVYKEVETEGRGSVIGVKRGGREIRLGVFPISIDFKAYSSGAASKNITEKAKALSLLYPDSQIILGIDRLDYTKGIIERFEAFRMALARYPELVGKVTFLQVVVPSRDKVPEYQALKAQIERLTSEINGRFTRPGWVPIQYFYRSLERDELLTYYRAAKIGLVTPLKDGMNLVAKEYCACNIDENGVLVLSEFAGAASQLGDDALLVNPYDIEGVADAILRAYRMGAEERRSRIKDLRDKIRRYDIFRWVENFLLASFARHLDDFPPLKEFHPQLDIELVPESSQPSAATVP